MADDTNTAPTPLTVLRLIERGIDAGLINDAVLIDTTRRGPSADMVPISKLVQEAIIGSIKVDECKHLLAEMQVLDTMFRIMQCPDCSAVQLYQVHDNRVYRHAWIHVRDAVTKEQADELDG